MLNFFKRKFDKLDYLESIIENVNDVVTILEADGRIRYESSSITSLLGYTPEEMIGKSAFQFIHPEDYKKVFDIFTRGITKPKIVERIEFRYRHKNGSWRYLESIAKNLLLDPNVHGIVVSSRDVTERRESEVRLRLQSRALEAASNGIVITNREGNIVWVNSAFTKMTGYTFEEAIGKNPRILKSGEQAETVYKQLWNTIIDGKTWHGELINRRKDGSHYFEKQTITPVMMEGKVTHFIAIKEDITSDKKLEAQFRHAQKMQAMGRLAGGVAHDFNNLLTVIIGQSDLLLNHQPLDDELRQGIQEIRNSGVHASNLTRQLLAFSRKQILQIKLCDLNEIVKNCDKMLRRLLGEDIALVTLLGDYIKPIRVDPTQIEQVVINLAVNARDAMPQGGKLFIETSQVTIDAQKASTYPGMIPGDYVLLKVKDTGTGVPAEVKAHIFEPFFTTKEKGKGTGLGLAMVYGVIKQSRGFIYEESMPNQGACFLIFLPFSDEKISAQQESIPSKLPTGTETILFVEDEEIIRELTVRMLTLRGFQVLEATNGEEAMRVIRNQTAPIQLLVTDMVMPYMGGGELAENFFGKFPQTPIIFTSGYTNQSTVQKWLDKGHRFLQKPYTHAELLYTVRDVLDKNAIIP